MTCESSDDIDAGACGKKVKTHCMWYIRNYLVLRNVSVISAQWRIGETLNTADRPYGVRNIVVGEVVEFMSLFRCVALSLQP